jgi:putative toxin-antitoxin system antitoxin component (TIGR02293 family)
MAKQARKTAPAVKHDVPEETLRRVLRLARGVFGDEAKARRWLGKPKRELGGATPLAFLASETGARRVEEMLHRIDQGMAA